MNRRRIKKEEEASERIRLITQLPIKSIKPEPVEVSVINTGRNAFIISSVIEQYDENEFNRQQRKDENVSINSPQGITREASKVVKNPKKRKLEENPQEKSLKPAKRTKNQQKTPDKNQNPSEDPEDHLNFALNSEEIIQRYATTLNPAQSPKSITPAPPKKPRRELRFTCDHCGKIFKSKYSVVWHMKQHMLTTPFNCTTCGKGFSYERSFRQHELTHAARVTCGICGKGLKPHGLNYHMRFKHSEERAHQCPQCPKRFKTRDNIVRHLMRHTMGFKCEICGRAFAENSRLQMHLRFHTHPAEFECGICGKTFEHIERHVKRLHVKNRERVFKCSMCEYAADSKQTIARHEKIHAKGKKKGGKIQTAFACEFCDVKLLSRQGYKSHLRHFHNGNDLKRVKKEESEESGGCETIETNERTEVKVEKEEVSVIQ